MPLLRTILFNIVFYGWNAFFPVAFFPCLVLPPRRVKKVIWIWHWVIWWAEKHILGLTFEVRGRENLPSDPRFIFASKHQSAFETTKLWALLPDPGIIHKHELHYLPVWGWWLWRSDQIPVRRDAGGSAIPSMIAGAQRMIDQGRPVAIYPQGTRVAVGAERPYRWGVAKLYQALDVPVVPCALNSGLYWPRKAFIKKPGHVVFQILPPIPPGLSDEDFLERLKGAIEPATDALVAEGRAALRS